MYIKISQPTHGKDEWTHILGISDGENGSHGVYYCQDVSSVQKSTSVLKSTTSGQERKFCGSDCLFCRHVEQSSNPSSHIHGQAWLHMPVIPDWGWRQAILRTRLSRKSGRMNSHLGAKLARQRATEENSLKSHSGLSVRVPACSHSSSHSSACTAHWHATHPQNKNNK